MGKREIARYEQFLFFSQCFQKLSVVEASKRLFMEKRVESFELVNTLSINPLPDDKF